MTVSHPKNPPCFKVEAIWSLVLMSTQFALLNTTFIVAPSQAFQHSLNSKPPLSTWDPQNQPYVGNGKRRHQTVLQGKTKENRDEGTGLNELEELLLW